jgi:hypothetical protein
MESGLEVRFPVVANPRLAKGTAAELNQIDISPLGLHWPALDEDLSLRGLLDGNYGQVDWTQNDFSLGSDEEVRNISPRPSSRRWPFFPGRRAAIRRRL